MRTYRVIRKKDSGNPEVTPDECSLSGLCQSYGACDEMLDMLADMAPGTSVQVELSDTSFGFSAHVVRRIY